MVAHTTLLEISCRGSYVVIYAVYSKLLCLHTTKAGFLESMLLYIHVSIISAVFLTCSYMPP